MNPLKALNQRIVACDRCQRLREYCAKIAVEKRAAYRDQAYWGRPVPNVGDAHARVLLVGLAPGAHGANRTGRMFTGDPSGDFLMQALFEVGFANQPQTQNRQDGLKLNDVLISGVAHCAPPGNKLTAQERANCAPFLDQTIKRMAHLQVILALGGVAWRALLSHFSQRQIPFAHERHLTLDNGLKLVGCYHPSPHNTYTGRLTSSMLVNLLHQLQNQLDKPTPSGGNDPT